MYRRMAELKFICSRCGREIHHAGDPIAVAALNELYRNPEFAICGLCMSPKEKQIAIGVIVQKIVDYYASNGLNASIKTEQFVGKE